MHFLALEALKTLDVGPFELIEVSPRRDHNVGVFFECLPCFGPLDSDVP